ncbi:Nramp family divalent metal transporter [Candidatus Collierbacteria bacterium]|nr:Nramp family divalent metal transporter [Candidatus Collierbacteria bacterium]
MFPKLKKFFKNLGPGLITGAADDDPSGIATYSQTGAQFGYGMLWTAIFMLPFQAGVQEAAARIGAVTGRGIAANIKQIFGKKILYPVVFLLVVANTINIGADIGAMAAAADLIFPIGFIPFALVFTSIILLLEIFTSYKVYSKILKWSVVTLLAYPVTVFMINQPWKTVLAATFIPHLEFSFQFLFIITGVLGTTISPYMFFWQASTEVEEEKQAGFLKYDGRPWMNNQFMRNLRLDNFVGMLSSEIGTWAIILVAATVLNSHGITDIKTAADAARALEPLVNTFPNAGYLAKAIFAVGIMGLGFLSIPVLAGSAAYAVAETFNFKEGLNLKFKKAPGFYGIIIVSMLIGLLINFIGVDPTKALVYTAVINGVVAVPLIFVIAKIANDGSVLGQYKSGKLSNFLIGIAFTGLALAALGMLLSLALSFRA